MTTNKISNSKNKSDDACVLGEDVTILFSCAHFAHLIGKAMWTGSQRPTPKSMGQNDHLIFLRNNTEKKSLVLFRI